MNKKVNLAIALLVAASIGLTLNACKKTTDPDPVTTTKTLNKSLLVGKKWLNKGSVEQLDIRANGVFFNSGTWKWLNNSDTLEVDIDGPITANKPEQWKVYWSAEHEMACKRAGTVSGEVLFKDAPW